MFYLRLSPILIRIRYQLSILSILSVDNVRIHSETGPKEVMNYEEKGDEAIIPVACNGDGLSPNSGK